MLKNRSSLQNNMIGVVGASLLVGFILVIGLLARVSSSFRDAGADASTEVGIGFMSLIQLTKSVGADGASLVHMRFESGLAWYAAFWLALGCGLGYLRWRHKKTQA